MQINMNLPESFSIGGAFDTSPAYHAEKQARYQFYQQRGAVVPH